MAAFKNIYTLFRLCDTRHESMHMYVCVCAGHVYQNGS